jgi:hypothetical protein
MLTFDLSDEPLAGRETERFSACLDRWGVDEAVWDVYGCLPAVRSGASRPLVVRAYRDSRLAGAALVVHCRRYGATLFASPLLRRAMDALGWSGLVWVRTGFCAETIANPGFAADGEDPAAMAAAMLGFLRRRAQFVLVVDRAGDDSLHRGMAPYPYPPDGAVRLAGMAHAADYLARHRNIRRKVQEFRSRGGAVQAIWGSLEPAVVGEVRACLDATARRALMQAPFQDLFADLAAATCRGASPRTLHLIARAEGDLLGYHSFLRSGRALHMMHGAFARDRATTHHAYEVIMVESVRCAIEAGLDEVRFGAVMNETKRRMVNAAEPAALYFHSRHRTLRTVFSLLHPFTQLNRPAFKRFAGGRDAAGRISRSS